MIKVTPAEMPKKRTQGRDGFEKDSLRRCRKAGEISHQLFV